MAAILCCTLWPHRLSYIPLVPLQVDKSDNDSWKDRRRAKKMTSSAISFRDLVHNILPLLSFTLIPRPCESNVSFVCEALAGNEEAARREETEVKPLRVRRM